MNPLIDLDAVHLQLVSALEQERVAVVVMRAALPHAGPASRWRRWNAVLEQAQRGEQALLAILHDLRLDADLEAAARRSVRAVGEALLRSLQQAPRGDAARAAQECVRLVEQRERGHWELLGELLAPAPAPRRPLPRAPRQPPAANPWLDRAAQFRLQRPPRAACAAG